MHLQMHGGKKGAFLSTRVWFCYMMIALNYWFSGRGFLAFFLLAWLFLHPIACMIFSNICTINNTELNKLTNSHHRPIKSLIDHVAYSSGSINTAAPINIWYKPNAACAWAQPRLQLLQARHLYEKSLTAPWQNILNSNYVHTYNTLSRGGLV